MTINIRPNRTALMYSNSLSDYKYENKTKYITRFMNSLIEFDNVNFTSQNYCQYDITNLNGKLEFCICKYIIIKTVVEDKHTDLVNLKQWKLNGNIIGCPASHCDIITFNHHTQTCSSKQ